jgi:LuxR family transcriptional regulator, maltose regulon positive regulatory protein
MAQAALGQALYLSGRLAEARPPLEELVARVSGAVQPYAVISALAVLSLMAEEEDDDQTTRSLAERAILERAHELVERLADPGVLPTLLQQSRRVLDSAPRRQAKVAAPLTERELAVLRLLPTRLSTREIGRELNVSVNTVRSQVQAVYRKLQVASRVEP